MRVQATPRRFGDGVFKAFIILSLLWVLPVFPDSSPAANGPDTSPKPRRPVAGPSAFRHFYGRLESLDLSRHPMTLSAILGGGRPLVFRFAGLLVPDTVVISEGRAVGVKSLKKGQLIKIDYREEAKGGLIGKIFILPVKVPESPGKTGISSSGKKASPEH